MRAAGEPRLDLGRLVGGIVVHDDMDLEPFGHPSVDLFEEVQELGRSVTLVAFADDEPRGDIECGKQRGRTMPHVAVRATFGYQTSSVRPAVRDPVPVSGSSHRY